MRYFYTLALGLVLGLAACAGSGSKALKQSTQGPVEPTRYTYRVVAQYPHAVEAYTQGFCFGGDRLWEGTGEYGRSELRTLDLEQGNHTTHHRLPRQEFGEGVAYLNGLIYQLTWESSICHVYDAATMEKVADRRYAGEGWGLTTDGEKLYLSNGSAASTPKPLPARRPSPLRSKGNRYSISTSWSGSRGAFGPMSILRTNCLSSTPKRALRRALSI